MGYLTRSLTETITWWSRSGVDGSARDTFTTPVTILGRWEDRTDLIRNTEGVEVPSRATVFLERDVAARDWLYRGASRELNPRVVAGAGPVLRFDRTPRITDPSESERRALL